MNTAKICANTRNVSSLNRHLGLKKCVDPKSYVDKDGAGDENIVKGEIRRRVHLLMTSFSSFVGTIIRSAALKPKSLHHTRLWSLWI